MGRSISQALESQMAAMDMKPVVFFEGEIAGTTLRLWTGNHNIQWDNKTWLGNGWLHGISSLKGDKALVANGASVTLTGVPSELIATMLGNVQQSSTGKLWLGFVGNDKQVANFIGVNSERLKRTDNASLSFTGSFTLSCWVKFNTTTQGGMVSKYLTTGNQRSYYFGLNGDSRPYLTVSPNGIATTTEELTIAVSTGQWYHLLAYYDGTKIAVRLDNANEETTAYSSGIYDSTADFFIAVNNLDGQMRCVGIWDRALSNDEMTELYNDGYPVYYDNLSLSLKGSLVSYWDLDEISAGTGAVTRNDSFGNNHLTDENTVGSIRASDTLLIAEPLPLFTGLLDQPTIHETSEAPLIELTYESELIRLNTANVHRYTDEGQRAFYPNDKGFEYVAFLEQWNGYWGRQEAKNE